MRGLFGKLSETFHLRRADPQAAGEGAPHPAPDGGMDNAPGDATRATLAAGDAASVGSATRAVQEAAMAAVASGDAGADAPGRPGVVAGPGHGAAMRFSPEPVGPDGRALDPQQVLVACHTATWEWDLITDELTWGPVAPAALGHKRRLDSGEAWASIIAPGSGESRRDVVLAATGMDHGDGAPFRCRYVVNAGRGLCLIEERGRWFAGADGRPVRVAGVLRATPMDGRQPLTDPATRRLEPARDIVLRTLTAMLHDPARGLRSISVAHVLLAPQRPGVTVSAPEVMDRAAAAIARRLRRTDVVAALDPGQFAVLLNACDDGQGRQAAIAVARSIERSCPDVFAHIGLVTATGGGADAAPLLERAREAARIAADGGQMLAVLAPDAPRRVPPAQAPVAPDMLALLNHRAIALRRRPLLELGGAGLRLEEALPAAPCHGASATMGPGGLASTADRMGLSLLLDQRMLEQAVRLLAREGAAHVMLRIAAGTLMSPEWRGALAAWLGAHPGVSQRLVIALDEAAFRPGAAAGANSGGAGRTLDPRAMAQHFAMMKALGVGVGVAGYGAGWLRLEDLAAMAVDLACINGLFVNEGLSLAGSDRFVVRALVDGLREIGVAAFAPTA